MASVDIGIVPTTWTSPGSARGEPVACPASATGGCAGKVGLETAKGGKALAKQKTYKVAAGKKAKVKVKLSKKGLRLVRPGRTTKVRVELTLPGSKKVQVKRTIKVRRG